MLDLTPLGTAHTAISLVALAAGTIALIRQQEIPAKLVIGKRYIWTTVITGLTGFPIMRHGGLGAAHALGVITLILLIVAAIAGMANVPGAVSRQVETICYSATFLFHWIPAVVETSTRLPRGDPWVADRDGPELQAATGVLFLLFVIGVTFQILRLRAQSRVQVH